MIEFTDPASKELYEKLDSDSNLLMDEIIKTAKKELKKDKKYEKGFEKRLNDIWNKPLAELNVLIQSCTNEGTKFNRLFRKEASENNDLLFDVLVRSSSYHHLLNRQNIGLTCEGSCGPSQVEPVVRLKPINDFYLTLNFFNSFSFLFLKLSTP